MQYFCRFKNNHRLIKNCKLPFFIEIDIAENLIKLYSTIPYSLQFIIQQYKLSLHLEACKYQNKRQPSKLYYYQAIIVNSRYQLDKNKNKTNKNKVSISKLNITLGSLKSLLTLTCFNDYAVRPFYYFTTLYTKRLLKKYCTYGSTIKK